MMTAPWRQEDERACRVVVRSQHLHMATQNSPQRHATTQPPNTICPQAPCMRSHHKHPPHYHATGLQLRLTPACNQLPISCPLPSARQILRTPAHKHPALFLASPCAPTPPTHQPLCVCTALPHELHLLGEVVGVACVLPLLTDAVQCGLERECALHPRAQAHCGGRRGGASDAAVCVCVCVCVTV